jgi:hypothetical protein
MVTAFDYIAGITFRIGLQLGYIKRRGHLQRFQKAADVLINWTLFKKAQSAQRSTDILYEAI